MTIGDKIKEIRQEQNLTQNELASKMGFTTKGAVSKIEASGDDITLKNIKKAASALNVHPNVLMGWDEKADNDLHTFLLDSDNKELVSFIRYNVPKGKRKKYYDAIKTTITMLNTI